MPPEHTSNWIQVELDSVSDKQFFCPRAAHSWQRTDCGVSQEREATWMELACLGSLLGTRYLETRISQD